jgi:hypothetical protein
MDGRKPGAFLSYARADDKHAKGKIVKICELLSSELEVQIGEPFPIFVDRNHIDWGENWESRIYESLDAATLLIPVLTPSYFKSRMCRNELSRFLRQERRMGRSDLILPIYYIETAQMEHPPAHQEDNLAQELVRRQYVDWRELRRAGLDSRAVSETIEDMAKRMRKAIHRGLGTVTPSAPTRKVDSASVAKVEEDPTRSARRAIAARGGLGVLRRRRLAQELRRLRESSGLTIDQVANDLELSPSTVARMEVGHVRARRREVAHMLDLYKVSGQQREAILRLVAEAERPRPAWWADYEVSRIVATHLGFEDAADSIYTYEPSHVPELLQIQEYAREIIRGANPNLSPQGVERRVELRMARQASFFDSDRALSVVLDEAPLRRVTGGREIMRAQLFHLIEIAGMQTVTMRILPFAAASGISGPFTTFSFSDSVFSNIVYVENDSNELYIESSDEVQSYRQLFERLIANALAPHESIDFVLAIAKGL